MTLCQFKAACTLFAASSKAIADKTCPRLLSTAIGFILGLVLSATVSILYSRIRGQTGLGWGDVKLIAAVGALIGWQLVPWFIFLASTSALLYVILQIIIRGKQAGKERIPFGPFLCGSSWLVWIYSIS